MIEPGAESGEGSGDEYDDELVELLELVWGEGFLAPGGVDSVRRCVADVDLHGAEVLDIGCGVGGADLVLAGMGARVTGIDIEAGLIDRARRRAERAGVDIDYRQVEPGPLPFAHRSFDHVFTHAAIIHVPDKLAMFAEVFRVLRPGGWLLAYDWLRGTQPYSADMYRWFELEGLTYAMDHLDNYLGMLVSVGFEQVTGTDVTSEYRHTAHQEHERMIGSDHDRMTALLGPQRRDHFVEDWRMLAVVLDNGELRPAYIRGRRPP